jgi:ATP phosphoribosyltransferase regulatory subunit
VRLEPAIPAPVLEAVRAPFLRMGAMAMDAPILQPLGLFLDFAGETLRERLFVVQGPGGAESCLRPDFTLPAVRAHVDGGAVSGRYLYEGHAFRVAPPGATRAEEFLQIGLEVFGPAEDGDPAEADARMAALAWRAAAAGGRTDLTLLLGDVGLYGAFIDTLGLADPLAARLKRAFHSPRRLRLELDAADTDAPARSGDRLAGLLAGLSEADATLALEDIWALAGITPVGGRSAAEIVHRLVERAALAKAPRLSRDQGRMISRFLAIADAPAMALEAVAELAGPGRPALAAVLEAWGRRLTILDQVGIPAERLRLSTAFGRTFGYYDGPLFEVRSAALAPDEAVAAGGRYDGVPGRLGASRAMGAVGCMVRPGRAWSEGWP